jgi:hypothetical protein
VGLQFVLNVANVLQGVVIFAVFAFKRDKMKQSFRNATISKRSRETSASYIAMRHSIGRNPNQIHHPGDMKKNVSYVQKTSREGEIANEALVK